MTASTLPPEPGEVHDPHLGYPVDSDFTAADEDDSPDEDLHEVNDYEEDE